MSSEIEVVDEIGSRDAPATTTEAASTSVNGTVIEEDNLGYYALQWASLNNRPVAAQYILEHGGDVNVADHTGQTALHWSSVRGSVQVAELLLQEGARVNATDMNGYQGNARRLFDKRWDGNTRLGQLSKFGLAPVLWCMIFVLLVMYVHSVIIGMNYAPSKGCHFLQPKVAELCQLSQGATLGNLSSNCANKGQHPNTKTRTK